MATGKSCSRWFAPLAALLMVVSLSGCFDKEGDQRKAFIDFLQNTVMRSGERLPTLTADQKKQFGPFVSDYAILYGYSQQVNQAMDSGLRPVVDSVNAIRVPQDYVTQSGPLREMNGSLGVLAQQLQNAKLQADAAHSALKQSDDLKPVFDQAFTKVVTTPADALQPLIPAAQTFTQQLVMVGDYIAQQGTQVSFVANGIQFPTSQQASEYNKLIAPLPAQHQAFNQAWTTVFDQAFTKVVTTPADALQPLIPAAQTFTQQLVMVGDYIAQQGTQVSFVANGIQFPTSQQASEYNKLIAPLPAQHQAFNQAWTTAVTATQ